MTLDEYEIARRHTAEHIFMKTLVDMLENTRVVKVVHEEDINKIILESDLIEWNDVVKASIKTNEVIQEGRDVYIEYYDSIEEAKRKYPGIRAYEARISGEVRVVVINGYDISACKMPHVSNTRECIMFLPVNLTKVKGRLYEVEYYAGSQAIHNAVKYIGRFIEILRKFNVDYDKINKVLDNMNKELSSLKRSIKELSEYIAKNTPYIDGKYRYLYLEYPYLDLDAVGRVLSKRLDEVDVGIVFSYDGEKYRFILASSKIELEDIFKNLINVADGRGGGRRDWYMGYIKDIEKGKNFILDQME